MAEPSKKETKSDSATVDGEKKTEATEEVEKVLSIEDGESSFCLASSTDLGDDSWGALELTCHRGTCEHHGYWSSCRYYGA
jgi:hypothetical protein